MKRRILVVGHGLIGKQRARAVCELAPTGACELAGTVDPVARDPNLYAGARHYPSLDAVEPNSYDAAVIAVPHDLARDSAVMVARAGKPFLLEKPLGTNLADARAIAAAVEASGCQSFVGYNYRFLPAVRGALQRVAEGRLGKLRSIDMLLGHGGHPDSGREWKLQPERAGGGVLIDPGVHLLDLLLLMSPSVVCRQVVATRGFWKTGIEEDVAALFSHDSLLATVRVSHIRWLNTFRIELVGEDGYALIEGRGGTYGPMTLRLGKRWGWNDGTKRSQRETEEAWDFGLQNVSLADELGVVIGAWNGVEAARGEPHPATIDEALDVAILCDSMYRSLERDAAAKR